MSKLFMIAGESGAGKTTLIRSAMQDFPDRLSYLTTYTTRKQREAYEPEYTFVSRSEYGRLRKASSHWDHGEYYGNWYGSDIDSMNRLTAAGRSLIVAIMPRLEIVQELTDAYDADPVVVYVKTNRKERSARLLGRGSVSEVARIDIDAESDGDFERHADETITTTNDISAGALALRRIIERSIDD